MGRKSISTRERVRLFELHDGICHICGCKIDGTKESWDVEHVVPWALTRDDSDENRRPAHTLCHKSKTKGDVRSIAKAKRVHAKHIGAYSTKNSIPGSKKSKYKRKIDGTVVDRETGEVIK